MVYVIDGMIFAGAILMVWNIWRYHRYMNSVMGIGDWGKRSPTLTIPFALLNLFLLGYLFVGLFGKPDIIMGGILFGGSIFVAIIVNTLEKVTDHIREADRLEGELKAAEESSKAKTVFLSNMSHEIRTPMNAIIGIDTIALKDEELKPETRQQFLKIDSSARHLLSLINDVLDMSRIETGQMIIRDEPFSMDDVLEQVCSIVQSQCDEKGLTFVTEVSGRNAEASARRPCCMGDSMKVKQILINLLGNAVKYTPAPGTVSFRTEAEGCSIGRDTDENCRVKFIISDTGTGMDEEYIPKIFEAFTQEDETSTNKYGGSGLGMAITKNLVDMMGGTISVKSKKGVGTEVTVSLDFRPAEAGPEEYNSVETAEAAEFSVEGCRILFAEDVDLNAEILEDLLEMEGMESDRAENGQVALDRFRESEPGWYDAILMDMRMPVMDGLESTRAIRALDRPDAKTIPIIALTANAFYSDVQSCLEAGMDAHLSKPVDTDLLKETLARLIMGDREHK